MEFKITTLCENTTPTSMFQLGEHGLSMLIEVEDDKILFDTGQTNTLIHNARFLGIDLTKINKVVLSHGHFDHTGGLLELLKINKNFELFAHPNIFYPQKYVIRKGNEIYIGPPTKLEQIEKEGIKLNLSKGPVKINEYIITTGEVPRLTDFEEIEKELLVKKNQGFKQDPLLDDLSLILKTNNGIVVLLGCAHSGIINILNYVKELTGENEIFAIIGGMHLEHKSKEQLQKIVENLKKFNLQKIGSSHCTGFSANKILSDAFGEKFFLNNVGKITIF